MPCGNDPDPSAYENATNRRPRWPGSDASNNATSGVFDQPQFRIEEPVPHHHDGRPWIRGVDHRLRGAGGSVTAPRGRCAVGDQDRVVGNWELDPLDPSGKKG